MQVSDIRRPSPSEYVSYYERYITLVPSGNIISILREQFIDTMKLLQSIDENKANYRYGDDKWSIKEVVGHLTDTERIFAYRSLRIGRNDKTPLAGFEQDDFVKNANFDKRNFTDICIELKYVRESTLALLKSYDKTTWMYEGVASGFNFTVRAIAYIIAGHELHHRNILNERYLT